MKQTEKDTMEVVGYLRKIDTEKETEVNSFLLRFSNLKAKLNRFIGLKILDFAARK